MKDKGLADLQELKQAIDGWGKDSARAVAEFALSGKGSFSDFANSVVKDLMTMMIYQNMTKPLMKAAGSWMDRLFNGGVSDAGASTAAANGMSYWKDGGAFTPNVQAFANGGTFTNSIVDRPTPFKFANGGKFNLGVMGEAGAEAVMPLTRIGGKLGVLAQGGGSVGVTNVVVNVTNNAGETVQANATQSTNSNGETIIDVMIDKVKGAMMQDVGSNGQFSQAFAGAYGLSRRAF
jgi:lambda family phage tail tape measure protein